MAAERHKFEVIWEELKPKIWAYALQSVNYHDAEDLVSTFSFNVWRKLVNGQFDEFTMEHVVGYLMKTFKHRTIDFIRSRGRERELLKKMKINVPVSTEPHHQKQVVSDMITLAKFNGLPDEAIIAIVQGYGLREIAVKVGISMATISRKLKKVAEDYVKQNGSDERLVCEDSIRKENEIMTLMAKEIQDGVWVVSDEETQVAQVLVVQGKVKTIMMNKDVDKNEVIKAVKAGITKTKEVKPEMETKISKIKKSAKTTKQAKPETKVKKAKKTVKVKKTVKTKPEVKVNRTLSAHIKTCGEGKCLCGCGASVDRRFKIGHDMKLKSKLKKQGDAKAKKLADALGWLTVIKWDK